jgi:hypothetical protein
MLTMLVMAAPANRCSHGVSAVTVAEAEGMGRRRCKKC